MLIATRKTVLNPMAVIQSLDLNEIERFQRLSGRGLKMSFFSYASSDKRLKASA